VWNRGVQGAGVLHGHEVVQRAANHQSWRLDERKPVADIHTEIEVDLLTRAGRRLASLQLR
jgi:hypothetical protein